MSRTYDQGAAKARQARRDRASARPELLWPTERRAPAEGVTSPPRKVVDAATAQLIEAALRQRQVDIAAGKGRT